MLAPGIGSVTDREEEGKATRRETLQSRLQSVFRALSSVNVFSSPPASELKFRYDEAVSSAAIAKCIDLNLLINSGEISEKNSFLYISNLRGMAEDLIVINFLRFLSRDKRVEYLTLVKIIISVLPF